MDEKITVKVSINLTGDAVGVKSEGGVLNSPTAEVEIACLPLDIPDSIEIDISNLSIGDSLQIGDIELDEKHTLISNPETVVASVTHAMREEEPALEGEEGEDLFMDEDSSEQSSGEGGSESSGEATESE